MKLIKKLDKFSDASSSGRKCRIGLFLCPVCGLKLEKRLYNGIRSKACGCIKYANAKKHGMRRTIIYNRWCIMKQRCSSSKSQNHIKHYQEKGIKVCDEWKNDFMTFYNWAMENGYQDDLELDRTDSSGDYCPENCRYVTMLDNRRSANSIFSKDQVDEIKFLKSQNIPNRKIAKLFNTTTSNIWRIGREGWV